MGRMKDLGFDIGPEMEKISKPKREESKMCTCEICSKEFVDGRSDDSGDYCDDCYNKMMVQSALDAGIPLSVIEGRTRLRDHFSPQYIASQINPKGDK